ncbi:MAG: class I tRNA ligase family protein [Candidatus Berkelbacteria bacterium]|nr:class I tRNA ligase family protein [Candidatus Berkelbacteria bacterium]
MVFRNAIQAIVINPNNNKILTLCWQKQPWTTFITGGIDDGEDATEAAKREIYEETGYKNLKFIRKLGGLVDSNFYANHKKENRKAHFQALVFELLDEEKDQISDKESAIHQLVWKTWEEIKNDGNLKCSEFNIWLDRFSNPENAFEDHGILINSNSFNGSDSETAKRKITEKLRKSGHGDFAINYKLRDWVFSRQRYWGEPIPIVHCKKCALRDPSGQGVVAVPEDQLPVKLPEIENYEPSGDGTSPLSRVESWVNTKCPKCGSEAKRETDTMPQWAGSCWYYLRFTDPKNDNKLISNEADKYFSPIDLYIGGAEHAVLHLLYARFWHKFLFDLKVVNFKEPFKKLKNVGLILAPDRQKMSKSRGNVISPEEIIGQFGADSLRMYEMFIGPFDQPAVWAKNGITGVSRFLENVCLSFEKNNKKDETIGTNLSQLINLITQKIEKSLFNTAVSDFMKFAKTVELTKMNKEQWDVFLKLLSPFAPHLSEKLWLENSNSNSIFSSLWPEAQNIEQQNYNLVVQINGKRKAVLEINKNLDRKEIENLVLGQKKIAFEVKRDKIKKIIFVEKKLINFVV